MKLISIQDQANEYIDRGWAVMPLKPKSKDPHFDLIKGAYLGATKDRSLVDMWFKLDPDANIGIAAITSGLVVIDIDHRNGGDFIPEMEDTYTVKTGDGFHLYYLADSEMQFRGSLGTGIDIKWRGYVAAAPSIHPNGKRYEVINDMNPIKLPADLYEMGAK